MKPFFHVSIVALAVGLSSTALASPKPLASKWIAVQGKENGYISGFDLSRVNFSKPGDYAAQITLMNGEAINAVVTVANEPLAGKCFALRPGKYADLLDTDVCDQRTKNDHLRWFSSTMFAAVRAAQNAVELATVEYK